jgi:antitoxin HicB
MCIDWAYPVTVRQEEDGHFHAYALDLPAAIASGADEGEAIAEMRQAVIAAVSGLMKLGMDLPPPSRVRTAHDPIALPGSLAAKASVYSAWKASHLTKTALAERMGRSEGEVRRILDPSYGTKLDQLEEAAVALGGRLVVSYEAPGATMALRGGKGENLAPPRRSAVGEDMAAIRIGAE